MRQTIQDNVLGMLIYDAKWDNYTGVVTFGDKQVRISIRFGSLPELVSEADISQARAAYLDIVARKTAIETEILREFIDLYNDEWRDRSNPIINQDEFLDTITPEQIDIALGQVQEVWYDDGDLFAGHLIDVRFKDDGSIREMGLTG